MESILTIDYKQLYTLFFAAAIGGLIYALKEIPGKIYRTTKRFTIAELESIYPDDSHAYITYFLGQTKNNFVYSTSWKANTLFSDGKYKPFISVGRGIHLYKYKNKYLLIWLLIENNQGIWTPREYISIYTWKWNTRILQEFLNEAETRYLGEPGKIPVYYFDKDGFWSKAVEKTKRNINSIFGNKDKVDEIKKDIKNFLDPETKRYYVDRGITYKRGLLLYGEPGTGKSTLVVAIASQFNLPVYYINLSGLNDYTLFKAFSKVNSPCIVLIEDIDRYNFVDNTKKRINTDSANTDNNIEGITLSGMLNVIDSIITVEGRILIITCNHIEKLDDALIRPGRIDKKLNITLLNSKDIEEMVFHYYNKKIILEEEYHMSGAELENLIFSNDFENFMTKLKTKSQSVVEN